MLAVVLCTVECHRFQPDLVLERNFEQHRESFAELLALAQNDRNYPHIHNDLGPKGLNQNEMAHYRRLFDTLGLQIGMNRYPEFPQAIFLRLMLNRCRVVALQKVMSFANVS